MGLEWSKNILINMQNLHENQPKKNTHKLTHP